MRLTKRLLKKLIKEEIENAQNSSPLAGLPEFQGLNPLKFELIEKTPPKGSSDPNSKDARYDDVSGLSAGQVRLEDLSEETVNEYMTKRDEYENNKKGIPLYAYGGFLLQIIFQDQKIKDLHVDANLEANQLGKFNFNLKNPESSGALKERRIKK